MENRLLEILNNIDSIDTQIQDQTKEYIYTLAMPPWALGKLLDLAVQLSGIRKEIKPKTGNKMIFTMAADHGIAEEGVSAFPQEVTIQMAENILLGGAGVNVLAEANNAKVQLVDIGVKSDLSHLKGSENLEIIKLKNGTNNFRNGPAMTRDDAIDSILRAYDLVTKKIIEEDLEIIGTGELGIGNTTPAAAILAVLTNQRIEDITGRGTGLDDAGLKHKIEVIKESIELNQPDPDDPIDVLAKVGGYDIAGIVGIILAAAVHNKPVIVDGFISTAGALIAARLEPKTIDYMIPSHMSAEPGHQKMWEDLKKQPLLDLNLRLGEGTGGALAMNIVDSACAILNNMLTFDDAGVSTSETAIVENFND